MTQREKEYSLEDQTLKAFSETPVTEAPSKIYNEFGDEIKMCEAPQEWVDRYVHHKIVLHSMAELMATPSSDIISKLTRDGSLTIHIFDGDIAGGDVIAPQDFKSSSAAWAWIDNVWEPVREGKETGCAAEKAADILSEYNEKTKKWNVILSFDPLDDAWDYYVETEHLRDQKGNI